MVPSSIHEHSAAKIGVALVWVLFSSVAEVAAQQCYLPFIWENKDRHVFGSVNTECGSCYGHTPPWGNWGVSSPWGSPSNDTQFMGWKSGSTTPCGEDISASRPQWNSCTGEYAPPRLLYYNHQDYTQQWSGEVKAYAAYSVTWGECPFDWDYDGIIDRGGCGDGTGSRIFTHAGQYMGLYELDFLSPAHVTHLYYSSSFVIEVWCDGWSCTSGDSAWDRSSTDIAAADIKVYTPGGYWNDPYNCCNNGVNYCQ